MAFADYKHLKEYNMEIERKFLIKHLPNLPTVRNSIVYQGYVSIDPEVRIRAEYTYVGKELVSNFWLTIKGNGTLSRTEIETPISPQYFNDVVEFIGYPLIKKECAFYDVDEHELCIAIVDPDTPDQFMYGEVEFDSEEKATNYTYPFEAEDITYDKSYKMKNYWKRTRID